LVAEPAEADVPETNELIIEIALTEDVMGADCTELADLVMEQFRDSVAEGANIKSVQVECDGMPIAWPSHDLFAVGGTLSDLGFAVGDAKFILAF
jgi:hypothetical protein